MAHLLAGDRRGSRGGSGTVCLQPPSGTSNLHARNPTQQQQHSDALSLAPPQFDLTSLHPHVLATTAPLLPTTCLPLRQQRPRRTGSVTHRVPEPAFGRAVHFLRRPPTSSRIELIANQTAARHKHRLCRPQFVSLLFLSAPLSGSQATTSFVLAPTAILTACFKQRANASILSRPILNPT